MTDAKHVLSVSDLNAYANLVLSLDGNLKHVIVKGELSGFKRHPSGHLYFTLKDEKASVRAVMFKYCANRISFLPKDGISVNAEGHVGLFEKDGSFQLYVENMQPVGTGDLYRNYVLLKEELDKKGWFAPEIKKTIPFLPNRVGVVTSASGAAIEDIRKVILRRFPGMPIVLYPASVQGKGAADEIAKAITEADQKKEVDVLIVGRGGGSLEDLWAFNEFAVANAVHDCSIPVISAVGHEIDYSICDFVADVRAATPSAAAEIAVPELGVLFDTIQSIGLRLVRSLQHGIMEKKAAVQLISSNLIMKNPYYMLDKPSQKLEAEWSQINEKIKFTFSILESRLKVANAQLNAYSGNNIFRNGYAIVEKIDGSRVTSVSQISKEEELLLKMSDGSVQVTVFNIENTEI